MLYKLLFELHEFYSPFNVFRYITFRTALAVLTAAAITYLLVPPLARWMRQRGLVQQIRHNGPANHRDKAGTPTMGGLVMVVAIFVSMLFWGDLRNPYVLVLLGALAGFSAIGFLDDYLKVVRHNPQGLRACVKFTLQVAVGAAVAVVLYLNPYDPYTDVLSVPFFKKWLFHLSWFYLPFAVVVMAGASNAVNLTDGIDGLAIGLVAIAALANGVMIYIAGHKGLAGYLHVLYLPRIGELTVFCGALLGASLGFLWYNAYPADVFMGDVGSLGLGGALGALAVASKQEIILAVVGGIFVAETLSVVLQVLSFKLTGRRLFRMAPIHHHFELKGWAEPKVIVRFWIVGIMLALLSLATFKVR